VTTIDLPQLRQWTGRPKVESDTLNVRHARLMAATLGLEQASFVEGSPLPPLWHWLYFLEGLPPHELGRDGHPARGGFLPPVPLENRMWAGGRVSFAAPLPLGAAVEKHSTVSSVEHKSGRSGDLVFVTVLHEIFHNTVLALSEEHDIVYRNQSKEQSARAQQVSEAASVTKPFTPDSTMLFRYSALTFNGHRIHYDVDYCRNVEGYGNLVIHGPLSATVLAGFAEEVTGKRLLSFNYRGVRPALLGTMLTLNAVVDQDQVSLWTSFPDGSVSMQAEAATG
jgi:3-methylfumaryl-CoA hydratase